MSIDDRINCKKVRSVLQGTATSISDFVLEYPKSITESSDMMFDGLAFYRNKLVDYTDMVQQYFWRSMFSAYVIWSAKVWPEMSIIQDFTVQENIEANAMLTLAFPLYAPFLIKLAEKPIKEIKEKVGPITVSKGIRRGFRFGVGLVGGAGLKLLWYAGILAKNFSESLAAAIGVGLGMGYLSGVMSSFYDNKRLRNGTLIASSALLISGYATYWDREKELPSDALKLAPIEQYTPSSPSNTPKFSNNNKIYTLK